MIRSLAAVLAALRFVAPHFEPSHEAAELLQEEAHAHNFDPYTEIAYVEHESGWSEGAVGAYAAGEMLGLGQIRLENYPQCWDLDVTSVACFEKRARLLTWEHNLHETARMFAAWRSLCEFKVGKSDARYWLQGMMGWDAKRHTVCGHRRGRPLPIPAGVASVLRRRAELARKF